MAKCSIGDDDNAIRPIVAVYVTNMETGERERIYALLDTGAARDFLTLKCARRLGLHLRDAMLSTTGINGLVVKPGYLARFQLESLNGKYVCEVTHGQGCYDPVSRPVPRDGIRDGTGRVFSKHF